MRQIGLISSSDLSQRFADHLRAGGIACTVDQGTEGFRVWVHDDDRVAEAKAELPEFLANPNDQRYRDASRRAMTRIREDVERQKAARSHTVNLAEKWSRPAAERTPLTFSLIALSVVVAYFTGLNLVRNDPLVDRLWFSNDGTLQPILHGEVWRIISPIFLHYNLMHLLFNMLWLRQFGIEIESRLGTFKFLGMVLSIAAFSDYAEFWSHPHGQFAGMFGGMSGVVYGLFGYIWVKGKLDPESGFDMPQQTVIMMLVWFVLCVLGVIRHVANFAHGGGLVAGITIAFCGILLKTSMRRKS